MFSLFIALNKFGEIDFEYYYFWWYNTKWFNSTDAPWIILLSLFTH